MKFPVRPSEALPPVLIALASLTGLSHWPLWRAEMWSWMLVGMSFGDMWAKLAEDFHPPGYFLLLWLALDADSPDWMLRFPSVIGAVGTVAFVGIVGRRWLGAGEGFFAALALALSPFLIVYGGVARGYALLAFATSGLLVAGAQLVAGDRVRVAAAGLFVAGAAAIYLHYAAAAALVATSLGIAAGLWARPDRGAGRWLWAIGAMVAVGLVFVPWVFGPMRAQQVDVSRLPRSLHAIGYLLWPVGHQQPLANVALLALAVVGVAVLLRRRAPIDRLLLAWPLCGVLIPLALSDRSDIQSKYYIQIWFLPAWGLLVGVGTAAVVRRLASFQTGAWVFGAALVASAVGPLVAIWKLPAAPFEVLNGTTVYDVRREEKLLRSVVDAIPAGSFPDERFSSYARYFSDMPMNSPAPRWLFRRREDMRARSIHTQAAFDPCSFPHAFAVVLTVPGVLQCEAIRQGIVAAVVDDPYPPYLLELAARARMRGEWDEAERLALAAGAVPTGWSDPVVFLAQLYTQQGQLERALGTVEAAIEGSLPWDNFFVTREYHAMQAELLRELGRDAEAEVAEHCAHPATRIPCAAATPG